MTERGNERREGQQDRSSRPRAVTGCEVIESSSVFRVLDIGRVRSGRLSFDVELTRFVDVFDWSDFWRFFGGLAAMAAWLFRVFEASS